MASSNSMNNEEFSERVKKTFGSLFSSMEPSPSSLSNPLWSLTGSEVQKKEWRRDIDTSRDSNPCSSSFDDYLSQARKNSLKNLKNYRKELEDDIKDLDDDDNNDEDGGREEDINDWDVKSSIGLDSTLDNEDEEDTYDKVAVGRENAGDRLYMRDVTDRYDSHVSSQDDLPSVAGDRGKDPRANIQAAKIRLKEDDAEAIAKVEEHKHRQSSSTPEKDAVNLAEHHNKLKPILKRKEHESPSKPSKRVRFDPSFINNDERIADDPSNKVSGETITQVNGSALNEKVSQVPGYVQNPSNYTRYSLDSTDELSDKSNTSACLDFLEMVKKMKNPEPGSNSDVSVDLPKSIPFVPKKKSDTSSKGVYSEVNPENESDVKRPSMQSTFVDVAPQEQEAEVGDMDVDEPKTSVEPEKGVAFRKNGRQYRNKPVEEEAA